MHYIEEWLKTIFLPLSSQIIVLERDVKIATWNQASVKQFIDKKQYLLFQHSLYHQWLTAFPLHFEHLR